MKLPYRVSLTFDHHGKPPAVFLVDATGKQLAEIYEEPTLKAGCNWSMNPHDWELGELTLALLDTFSGAFPSMSG